MKPKSEQEKAEILTKLSKELHYLMEKPIDNWDEYDESNWDALTQFTVFQPQGAHKNGTQDNN